MIIYASALCKINLLKRNNHEKTALHTIETLIRTISSKKKKMKGNLQKVDVYIQKKKKNATHRESKILIIDVHVRTRAIVITPVDIQLLLKEIRFNFSKWYSDC